MKQITTQFREVFLEGKWVANTNLKEQVSGLDWKKATTNVGSLNSIALLIFHLNYYVAGVLQVLEGGTLDIRDKFSFDMPPINSQEDWERLQNNFWRNAERFAELLEDMPAEKLDEPFVMEQYGDYRRNIHGMIEHAYYHFGQIVLIRKMIENSNWSSD